MDARTRRFLTSVAIAWFVWPLLGAMGGMGLPFLNVQLPYLDGDYAQFVGWSVLGGLVGVVVACIQTAYSYWRNFVR